MDLAVNIPLFEALDRCWQILAECFEPAETGIRRTLIDKYWPKPRIPVETPEMAAATAAS
jgi:V/A-type H+-transporting ATPase subunit B